MEVYFMKDFDISKSGLIETPNENPKFSKQYMKK